MGKAALANLQNNNVFDDGEKRIYMLNGLVCFPREPVVKLLFLVTSPTGTFNMNEN